MWGICGLWYTVLAPTYILLGRSCLIPISTLVAMTPPVLYSTASGGKDGHSTAEANQSPSQLVALAWKAIQEFKLINTVH